MNVHAVIDPAPPAAPRARSALGRALAPRALALAVGLVAALALLPGAGIVGPGMDAGFLGLAASGGLFALALLLRGSRASAYLRLFIAIFAVEFVLVGGAAALGALGALPAGLAALVPPRSFAVTVGVFGVLLHAVDLVPVIRRITALADPFFVSDERTTARVWPLPAFAVSKRALAAMMVVFLVLVNQAQVAISVRLSFFNRDWFNAIQEKNEALFWSLLIGVFLFWAAIAIVSNIVEYVVQAMLQVRWRADLTERTTRRWLDDGTHYRLALEGEADNPDQRVAEDVNQFVARTYGFSITLLAQVTTLVSFSIILWGISSSFTIPGTDIAVPGLLFWIALGYAALGTLVTHLIGRALVPLYFQQQKREADFRFGLARLREYAEQVALLGGEAVERRLAMGRFGAIVANVLAIVRRRTLLLVSTSAYGQLSPIIPYVVAAPFYFAGKVQLGTLTQTAGAFARVEGALAFFVDSYVSLADYAAVVARLDTFERAVLAHEGQPPAVRRGASADGAIALHDLALALPGGRVVVRADGFAFRPGEAALVTGPSGSGKSTLFRAIAGVWPFGQGRVSAPPGARVLLLPQRPYLPQGTLRAAVAYPAPADAYPDADVRAALDAAGLPALKERLDEDDAWGRRLSGGEAQRVALARALLSRPDWLFLDEATAALDEPAEAAAYRALARELPGTTVVSIGHRSTLDALHARKVALVPGEDGAHRLEEREAAPA